MIGIVGATGFTGKLVASELQKRGAKFFVSGRNEGAVKALSAENGNIEWRILDVQRPQTYAALDGCSTIINCAGPFLDYGEAIVQEAIKRKCHYLDLTGEQAFIKLVYDKYDLEAKSAGVCLIPAFAFEYAIGDAAAAILCARLQNCNTVEIAYLMDGSNNTSAGTRKSIIRAIAASGYQLRKGQLIESAPAAFHKRIENERKTLISFPGGEVLMLPKHSPAEEITTYMAMEIAPQAISLIRMFGQGALRLFGEFFIKNAGRKVPSLADRASTVFQISVTASGESGKHSLSIKGTDPYGLTAVLVAEAAMHIEAQMAGNGNIPAGAISPSMLAGAELIRSATIRISVSWT